MHLMTKHLFLVSAVIPYASWGPTWPGIIFTVIIYAAAAVVIDVVVVDVDVVVIDVVVVNVVRARASVSWNVDLPL